MQRVGELFANIAKKISARPEISAVTNGRLQKFTIHSQ